MKSANDYYHHSGSVKTFHEFKPPAPLKTKIMNHKHGTNRTSANDLYNVYLSPEMLHDYKEGYKLTEGIYDIVNYEDCMWLLDTVLAEQENINFEIQVWHLSRVDQNSFTLTCRNKEGQILAKVENLLSDFYFDDLTIMKKEQVFCLPIEEKIY